MSVAKSPSSSSSTATGNTAFDKLILSFSTSVIHEREDKGTGRCRLSMDSISKLQLMPGDPVLISPTIKETTLMTFDPLISLPLPPQQASNSDTVTVAATRNYLGPAKSVTLQLETDLPPRLRNEVNNSLLFNIHSISESH